MRIYPDALDCGISPLFFWKLSLDEIKDIIDSYNRKEITKQKQRAIDNSILADRIIRGIGMLFSQKGDNVEIKQIWDYYPGLFEEEKKNTLKQEEINELEEFKQRRKRFAYNHNKQIGADDRRQ